jgi:hypothetical protein
VASCRDRLVRQAPQFPGLGLATTPNRERLALLPDESRQGANISSPRDAKQSKLSHLPVKLAGGEPRPFNEARINRSESNKDVTNAPHRGYESRPLSLAQP